MKIGIIGAGMIGSTYATLFSNANHEVRVGVRDQASPNKYKASIPKNVLFLSVEDAVKDSELIVCAVPFKAYEDLIPILKKHAQKKIVIDTGNYFAGRDGALDPEIVKKGTTVWLAEMVPESDWVKAFNTIHYAYVLDPAQRSQIGSPYLSKPETKKIVQALFDGIGLQALYAGEISNSKKLEPGSPVFNTNMSVEAVEAYIKGFRT